MSKHKLVLFIYLIIDRSDVKMADTDDSTFTAEEIVVQKHKKERKELQCMCSHIRNKVQQTTFPIILSFVYLLSGNIEKTVHRITPNLTNKYKLSQKARGEAHFFTWEM